MRSGNGLRVEVGAAVGEGGRLDVAIFEVTVIGGGGNVFTVPKPGVQPENIKLKMVMVANALMYFVIILHLPGKIRK